MPPRSRFYWLVQSFYTSASHSKSLRQRAWSNHFYDFSLCSPSVDWASIRSSFPICYNYPACKHVIHQRTNPFPNEFTLKRLQYRANRDIVRFRRLNIPKSLTSISLLNRSLTCLLMIRGTMSKGKYQGSTSVVEERSSHGQVMSLGT